MNRLNKQLNIGIIGCGSIGEKRAQAITKLRKDSITAVYDIDKQRMNSLAEITGAKTYSSWQALLKDPSLDAVIIATYHKILPQITLEALKHNKHVLAEKPLGNNAREAKAIYQSAKKYKRIVKVGFNHRFHPAVAKAFGLFKKGIIGKILYIRAVYGHGGRKNYDLEWRVQPKFTRGGELYDQGSHIIDMAHWFLGPFAKGFATVKNYYWHKTSLEDNGFAQLLTAKNQTVMFQTSLTQWKNRFNFEIFGGKGYLLINGLGRSYGVETLTLGTGVGGGKPPKQRVWQFPGADNSWVLEWQNFRAAVLREKSPLSSAKDNVEVMLAMDSLFKSVRSKKLEKIR